MTAHLKKISKEWKPWDYDKRLKDAVHVAKEKVRLAGKPRKSI